MKINSTSSLTIQADQALRSRPAPAALSTTGSNGFAVALFARRSPDDLNPSGSEATVHTPPKQSTIPLSPDLNTIYKCKNCNRRMKLSEAISYYGLPACPACVQACAPFEIAPEQSDSNQAPGGNS